MSSDGVHVHSLVLQDNMTTIIIAAYDRLTLQQRFDWVDAMRAWAEDPANSDPKSAHT